MKIYASALISALIFTGCASQPPEVQNLTPAESGSIIVLPTKLSYRVPQGIRDVLWEHGIMPGRYMAESKNEFGTFYRGEGRPIWLRPVNYDTPTTIRPGGIWVPKDPNKKLRIYSIYEDSIQTTNNLDQYMYTQSLPTGGGIIPNAIGGALGMAIVQSIIAADAGKIYLFDESPDGSFISSLENAASSKPPEPNATK